MKDIALWLLRKALYVAVGAGLSALVAVWAGVSVDNLSSLTLPSTIAALGAAVFGDLRRKLAPDFLQIVTGEDPRVDG